MHVARHADAAASSIAAAIGEPARARMLFCLLDGRARTSTELAAVASISPSTASVHLGRLKKERLVTVQVQGKHHYYGLARADVAGVLEGLSVLAGGARGTFAPRTPPHLRTARTCYDHLAGSLGVQLMERLVALGWISPRRPGERGALDLTPAGAASLDALGAGVSAARAMRRRFAYPCLDWSERRPHVGGALGAALLALAIRKTWVVRDLDSRALDVTPLGARELRRHFGLQL